PRRGGAPAEVRLSPLQRRAAAVHRQHLRADGGGAGGGHPGGALRSPAGRGLHAPRRVPGALPPLGGSADARAPARGRRPGSRSPGLSPGGWRGWIAALLIATNSSADDHDNALRSEVRSILRHEVDRELDAGPLLARQNLAANVFRTVMRAIARPRR